MERQTDTLTNAMTEEIGSDPEELFTNKEQVEKFIDYKDKRWRFVIKDLSWNRMNDIISASASVDKNVSQLGLGKYNRMILKEIVVESPFKNLNEALLKIDKKFGALMEEILIKPLFEQDETPLEEDPLKEETGQEKR